MAKAKKKWTKEQRRARSESQKKIWARRSKKQRKDIGKRIVKNRDQSFLKTKAYKEKVSKNTKIFWKEVTDEQRKAMRAKSRKNRKWTKTGKKRISKWMKKHNPMKRPEVVAKMKKTLAAKRTKERKAYLERRNAIRKLQFGTEAWQKEFNKRVTAGARRSYKEGRKCAAWKMHSYKGEKFRSTWELAFAKACDNAEIKWKYEPKTFHLKNTTYTPDFYLPQLKVYVEIKGYLLNNFWRKMIQFHRRYPKKRIIILDKKIFRPVI